MRNSRSLGIGILAVTFAGHAAFAQALPRSDAAISAADSQAPIIDLNWTPPALAVLSSEAAAKSSFTLDRTMLAAASGMIPDSEPETRQAIAKIDGISVHLLNFGVARTADQAQVEALREAYHRRGWKHLVTTSTGGALHNGATDVWLTMEGVNVRGAVVLVESPKSLTLATLKGDLSPVDLLHLRGHFGIPRFEADQFKDAKEQ
ncbi:MAG: DUF4252 domain-containing protein [Terracidiphilus sp.]|jgi:hypothetical protein